MYGATKLTDVELDEVLKLWEDGMGYTELGKVFNRSRSYMHYVITQQLYYATIRKPGPAHGPKQLTYKQLTYKFHKSYDIKPYGCHEWKTPTLTGYGTIGGQGAHRFAWELLKGRIPQGMGVLHKCDNKRCVNVDHLYIGDDKDNALDRKAMRYSIDELVEIERLVKLCKSTPKNKDPKLPHIAKKFNISVMTLHRMQRSSQWPCRDGVHVFSW